MVLLLTGLSGEPQKSTRLSRKGKKAPKSVPREARKLPKSAPKELNVFWATRLARRAPREARSLSRVPLRASQSL